MYRTTGPNPDNLFDLGQYNPPNTRQGKGKPKWGQGRHEAPVGEGRVLWNKCKDVTAAAAKTQRQQPSPRFHLI